MINILLPTDFSENSWNAINYAVKLYAGQDCTFYLYHAYTPVIYQSEYTAVGPTQSDFVDVVRNSSQEKMKKFLHKILTAHPQTTHRFETMTSFDTLISGIKHLIKSKNIHLVVMGTNGATGADEILFGTNTVHVIKDIKCPILAIPSNFDYEPPHEILFPTDLEVDFDQCEVGRIAQIASLHKARINVLHVSTGYELGLAQAQHLAQLKDLLKPGPYLYHELPDGDLSESINEFQISHKINFLAMVNNKKSFFENLFFESTVNKIGLHINVPFLVLPSSKA